MMIYEAFRQALRNIRDSKLRTLLTMLGIIIGVMAVIVIVGLGNGITVMMHGLYNTMNGDLLGVGVYNYGSRVVTVADMYAITDAHPELFTSLSPIVSTDQKAKVGARVCRGTEVCGINEDYLSIKKYYIALGRGLTYADQLDCKNVCVVGDYVARVLCGGNALGQTIKIGKDQYRIVGVLAPKVKQRAMQEGSSDDCVFVPYTSLMRLSGRAGADDYYITVADASRAAEAKRLLLSALEKRCGREDYYYVDSLSEELQSLQSMIDIVVAVLTAIAGISLFVGGIGIMNIMLVSVTERTREIGIRKALGAKESAILTQFVVEAAVTSSLGGALGVALGYMLSAAANLIVPSLTVSMGAEMRVIPSPASAITAFGISAGIGILFGYLPAKRAARLDPIVALRYD